MFKIITSILFIPAVVFGSINEISKFEQVVTYVEQIKNQEVLVVFDIDCTLMETTQCLGSVAWADYIIADFIKKGVSVEDAHKIENILWRAIQTKIEMRCVDPKTPLMINELKNQGVQFLCLTARTPEEADYTFKQLAALEINCSNLNQFVETHTLLDNPSTVYQMGIIFATPHHKKSDVFFEFLRRNKIAPETILFVDDKLHNVNDLAQACAVRGIHFVGLHFNRENEMEPFDPAIADIQWKHFPKIINDIEARAMLNQNR